MNHEDRSPEEQLDRWLDDQADGSRPDESAELADTAAYLQRQFGLPPVRQHRLDSSQKAKIRDRVLPGPTPEPKPVPSRTPGASGIVAAPARVIPLRTGWSPIRVATIISAALLTLIAVGGIGLLLRLGDTMRTPEVSATAARMAFAPAPALASPAASTACATDETLLLMPGPEVDDATFADLPFPVAWYRDGTLTVEQGGEALREIDIGDADYVRPAGWPDVVRASTTGGGDTIFVNIRTGETLDIGPAYGLHHWTDGPFVFLATDKAQSRWHIVDLRTFDQVDPSDRFTITPHETWMPVVDLGNASDDGTVLFIRPRSIQPVQSPYPGATPIPRDVDSSLPELELNHQALLVNGSLDDMSLMGPTDTTSGAMALSPDGRTAAWLAPSQTGGERMLTIVDSASGNLIRSQPVEATYSNSLLFNADGSVLYATSGETLSAIPVRPDGGTPATQTTTITLPDTSYHIAAAAPDRAHLLLARSDTSGESVLWVDVSTGEMRTFTGVLSKQFFESSIANLVSPINEHVLLTDVTREESATRNRFLDLTTGELVEPHGDVPLSGNDLLMISADSSTVLGTSREHVAFLDLETGSVAGYPITGAAADTSRSHFTLTADGSCAALTWPGEDDTSVTQVFAARTGAVATLPSTSISGWVAATSNGR